MRVYISADIEGVTDVTIWEETERGGKGYERACAQMTAEVAAACRGALAAGADEVVVKDAHDSALNLNHMDLPRGVKLIREWCSSMDSMVACVDQGFDVALFTGYHSEGGSDANPLAHTMTHTGLYLTKINGRKVSEMEINALTCAQYGVPVALVTGDKGLCETAKQVIPGVHTVAVKDGIGTATYNIHPLDAIDLIEREAKAAVEDFKNGLIKPISIPENPVLELTYKEHPSAKAALNYAGVEYVDPHTVRYAAKDFRDLLRAYRFIH
ncbi:MAG: M55 family metallopeptidase [Eubacterium sp.]|jgi:D-amino peptidase